MRKPVLILLSALVVLLVLNFGKAVHGSFFAHDEMEHVHEATHEHATHHEARHEARHEEVRRVERRVHVSHGEDTVIDQRFKVSEGNRLDVNVAFADVVLETGGSDEARVQVTLDGRDMAQAREMFEAMQWQVKQDGDVIRVEAESLPDRMRKRNKWKNMPEIVLRIQLPERFDISLHTSYGDIAAERFEGVVDLRTSYGDMSVESLRGEALSVKTSYGDVKARSLQGEDVLVHTSYGDISLGSIAGNAIEIHTSYGDVDVDEIDGAADLSTSYGDVSARLVKAAETSLRTSYGDIVISAPASLSADLDLRGSEVKIASALDFSGNVKKKYAEGQLNGGGSLVKASSAHGDVVLKAY